MTPLALLAGLIISAKSIIRFPELSRSRSDASPPGGGPPADADIVTEYFLLGSLTSWSPLANVVAVLLLRPATAGTWLTGLDDDRRGPAARRRRRRRELEAFLRSGLSPIGSA